MHKLDTFLANRDKFYGLADSALLSLFRFACGIAMARIAGAEGFATYILLISAAVIFQMLPTTLFLTPLLNLGNSGNHDSYTTLHRWAKRGILKSSALFIGLGTALLLLTSPSDIPLITGLSFLVAAATLLLQNFFRSRLQLQFKQKHALRADCITVASHITISAGLWHSGYDTQGAFWIGASASGFIGSALMRFYLGHTPRQNVPDAPLQDIAAQSGRVMLVGSIANTACSRLQPFAIGLIVSTTAIAQYGVAWTLIGPIRMLSMALTSLLRPRLSLFCRTNDTAAFKRTYHLALSLILATGSCGIIGSLFVGEWAIHTLFGPELTSATRLLPLAILYATIDAFTTSQMVARQIKDTNGPALTSKLRVHAAAISLILLLPMTYAFELQGTLGSLIIAELYYAYRLTSSSSDSQAHSRNQSYELS